MSNPQWSAWPLAQLKRLGRIRYGASQPPPEVVDGVPFVRATNVDKGRIRSEELLRVSPDAVPSVERLNSRDVIVVRSGAYAADSARVPPAYEGAIAGYDMVWRSQAADAGFVGWCLLSRPVLGRQLRVLTARAAQPHLNAEELGSVQVPCPPLPTQRAIAAFLDRETAKIDALLEKKRRLLDLLDEKRAALITRAVTRGLDPEVPMKDSGVEWLGKIPVHWEVRPLKRFSRRIQTGTTPPTQDRRYYTGGTIPWYGPSSFGDDLSLGEPSKLLSESAQAEGAARIFDSGSALIVSIGATLGRVCFLEQQGSANQQITGVAFRSDLMRPKYAAYQLKSLEQLLRKMAPNTTLPILDQGAIGSLPLLRPPQMEQHEIVEHLDKSIEKLVGLAAQVRHAISLLQEYRTALISAAVTGQIDVSEAAA